MSERLEPNDLTNNSWENNYEYLSNLRDVNGNLLMQNNSVFDLTANGTAYNYTTADDTIDFSVWFTIEAWVKPTTITQGDYHYVISKTDGGASNEGLSDQQYAFALHQNVDNDYFVVPSVGGAFSFINVTSELKLGEWNHIALVWDGSEVRVYVGGVLCGSYEKTGTLDWKELFSIGGRYNDSTFDSSHFFDGYVDDVRLWDYPRSQDELYENMYRDLPTVPSSLKAYYKFDSNTNDETGNNNLAEWGTYSYNTSYDDNWHSNVNRYRISEPLALDGVYRDSNINWLVNLPTDTAVDIYTSIQTGSTKPEEELVEEKFEDLSSWSSTGGYWALKTTGVKIGTDSITGRSGLFGGSGDRVWDYLYKGNEAPPLRAECWVYQAGGETPNMGMLVGYDSSSKSGYVVGFESISSGYETFRIQKLTNDSLSLLDNVGTTTLPTGWYKMTLDWQANGDLTASLYDVNLTRLYTLSANDTSFTSGAYGLIVAQGEQSDPGNRWDWLRIVRSDWKKASDNTEIEGFSYDDDLSNKYLYVKQDLEADNLVGDTHNKVNSTPELEYLEYQVYGKPVINTNNATNIGTTSATINGEIADLQYASSVTGDFEWKVDGGSWNTYNGSTYTSPTNYSYTLTDLTPNTLYYFRAKGTTNTSETITADTLSFTTDPKVTTNSDRDLETIGYQTANSNRDLTLEGSQTAHSDRNLATQGSERAYSDRDVSLEGKSLESSERAIQLEGYTKTDTTTDRSITLEGKLATQTNRDVSLEGFQTENSDRNASLTGYDLANTDRDISLEGYQVENSSRDIELSAKVSENTDRSIELDSKETATSERSIETSGYQTEVSTRSIELTGYDSAVSDRDIEILPQKQADSERNISLNGNAIANSTRDLETQGKVTQNTERNVSLEGITTDQSERSIELTGYEDTFTNRNISVLGPGTVNTDRLIDLTGKVTTQDIRDIELEGANIAHSDRNIETSGIDTKFSDRNTELTAKVTVNDYYLTDEEDNYITDENGNLILVDGPNERNFTLEGIQLPRTTRDISLTGKETATSDRNITLEGSLKATGERDITLEGLSEENSDRDLELEGAYFARDERNIELSGIDTKVTDRDLEVLPKVSTETDRDLELTAQETKQSDRTIETIGFNTTQTERSIEVNGDNVLKTYRDITLYGYKDIEDDRNVELTGKVTDTSDRDFILNGYESTVTDRSIEVWTHFAPIYTPKTRPYTARESYSTEKTSYTAKENPFTSKKRPYTHKIYARGRAQYGLSEDIRKIILEGYE